MASKLFVGNLPFTTTENDLQDYFGQVGQVLAVNIMQDRATGRSRGFAFVEMQSQDDAAKAITQLHKKDFQARTARPAATPAAAIATADNLSFFSGPPLAAPGGGLFLVIAPLLSLAVVLGRFER